MVKQYKNSLLHSIHQYDHVCNMESSNIFNQHSFKFIAHLNDEIVAPY